MALAPGDLKLPSLSHDRGHREFFLFSTPVLVRHFHGSQELNRKVASLVETKFDQFLKDSLKTESARTLYKTGEKRPSERTNAFYSWYADGDENRFLQDPNHRALLNPVFAFLQESVAEYFAMIGRDDIFGGIRNRSIEVGWTPIWPAIQHRKTRHNPHNHTFNHVSGVYFVRSPKSGPSLWLHDPRPTHIDWHAQEGAPGARAKVRARSGDVVLFPPWLSHSVAHELPNSDAGKDVARVTFPFNVQLGFPGDKGDEDPRCLDCSVILERPDGKDAHRVEL